MKEYYSKLSECLALKEKYITIENSATYYIERQGATLRLFFEKSNGKEDWRNNFDFPAKPYRDMRDKWHCHRGFLKVWKSIEPYIKAEIFDLSVSKIDIVGYSHGAAVAQLCYEYVKFNRPDVEVTGVGFGSPRVFWGFAKKAVKNRFKGFIVVRKGHDLITHVPPVLFGFRHICEVLPVGDSKGLIKDHYPEEYLASLASEREGTEC